MKRYLQFAALFLGLIFLSCKKEKKKEEPADTKTSIFSIRKFGLDEWNNFSAPSFVIVKSVRKDNAKPDSVLTNSDTINWAPIFKEFFETDISGPDFKGKYKYSQFPDNADETYNFFWEATDDDLYTQKLLVTMNVVTHRVNGIYIETQKKGFIKGETIKKLYYKPYHTIQISTDETSMIGKKSFTVVQYDFLL